MRVPSIYYIHQGERCERVDEKIVARRGPPTQDNYHLPRVFAEIFCSDMSRRPSKVNKDTMHCKGEVQSQPPVQGKQRSNALPRGELKTKEYYKFNSCLSSNYGLKQLKDH
jgi:hypothetical protein